jgi:hypothetical protein
MFRQKMFSIDAPDQASILLPLNVEVGLKTYVEDITRGKVNKFVDTRALTVKPGTVQ